MKVKLLSGFLLLLAVLVAATAYWWTQDAPRRQSLASLARLDSALRSGDRARLLDLLILPVAVRDRTAAEQTEFLTKALNSEISPDGLVALRKHGDYGALKELFPAEAEGWAGQAGVNADDCVAFRMERDGLRAEVVLLSPSTLDTQPSTAEAPYRIVRVNNVKQMADLNSATAEQNP